MCVSKFPYLLFTAAVNGGVNVISALCVRMQERHICLIIYVFLNEFYNALALRKLYEVLGKYKPSRL